MALEYQNLRDRYDRSQEEIEYYQNEVRALEKDLRAHLEMHQQDITYWRTQSSHHLASLHDAEKRYDDLDRVNDELQARLSSIHEDRNALQDYLAKSYQDNKALEERLHLAEEAGKVSTQEVSETADLRKELDEALRQLKQSKDQVHRVSTNNITLAVELERMAFSLRSSVPKDPAALAALLEAKKFVWPGYPGSRPPEVKVDTTFTV